MSVGTAPTQEGHDPGAGGRRLRLFEDPAVLRWGAHCVFWIAYFLIRTAAASAEPPDEPPAFPYLGNRALVVGTYFALTSALLALVAGLRADRTSGGRNITLVAGAIALTPLMLYGEQLWPLLLAGLAPDYPFASYLFQFGWALPLWGLTQALLGYHFEMVAQARAVSRAQALAYDAQIKMLHYQINPHFLFNTLNAISTLVLERRNEQAEAMLLKLAGFLRYSLDRQPTAMAALKAELEAQRKYLEIEQTRFEDKLHVRFDIEPGLEDARLPSLILQPILENAIKYAVTPRTEGGEIVVSARRDGDLLRIRVDDDGPGRQAAASTRRGLGLANARERLQLIYGERAGLDAGNREPRGWRVDLWLPLEGERRERMLASTLS